MKKTLFLVTAAIAAIFAACDSDEPVLQSNPIEDDYVESLRSEDEAIEIATKALNDFYPVKSRATRDFSNIQAVLLKGHESRNNKTTNPLYVVNFGNKSGYAIVAANKTVNPLLAITEAGSITNLNEIENPGLRLYIDEAMKIPSGSNNLDIDTIGQLVDVYRNDTVFRVNFSVAPRVPLKWGQNYPCGLLYPNRISGCVVTAGTLALSHFRYPETLNMTFPERTDDEININWFRILIQSNLSVGLTATSENQIASLSREIGFNLNLIHPSQDGIGFPTACLRTYFANFLPSDRFEVSQIIESKPVTHSVIGNGIIIMRGAPRANSGGHCWIIDGCVNRDYTVYVYKHKINQANEVLERQFDKKEVYSHINWGWNGQDNGYFDIDRLNTSQGALNFDCYYFTIKTK